LNSDPPRMTRAEAEDTAQKMRDEGKYDTKAKLVSAKPELLVLCKVNPAIAGVALDVIKEVFGGESLFPFVWGASACVSASPSAFAPSAHRRGVTCEACAVGGGWGAMVRLRVPLWADAEVRRDAWLTRAGRPIGAFGGPAGEPLFPFVRRSECVRGCVARFIASRPTAGRDVRGVRCGRWLGST
jgi:hypothetical protein